MLFLHFHNNFAAWIRTVSKSMSWCWCLFIFQPTNVFDFLFGGMFVAGDLSLPSCWKCKLLHKTARTKSSLVIFERGSGGSVSPLECAAQLSSVYLNWCQNTEVQSCVMGCTHPGVHLPSAYETSCPAHQLQNTAGAYWLCCPQRQNKSREGLFFYVAASVKDHICCSGQKVDF